MSPESPTEASPKLFCLNRLATLGLASGSRGLTYLRMRAAPPSRTRDYLWVERHPSLCIDSCAVVAKASPASCFRLYPRRPSTYKRGYRAEAAHPSQAKKRQQPPISDDSTAPGLGVYRPWRPRIRKTSACGSRSTTSAPATRASPTPSASSDVPRPDNSFLGAPKDDRGTSAEITGAVVSLELCVVGEGIETARQLESLKMRHGPGLLLLKTLHARRDGPAAGGEPEPVTNALLANLAGSTRKGGGP